MNSLLGMVALSTTFLGSQTGNEPPKWAGTWVLNLSESKFGPFLMPGAPKDLAILAQTLTLEKTANAIRLFGETTYRDSTGKHSSHDDTSLNLDAETSIGPVSFSVRPGDDLTFEIISKLNFSNPSLMEVSHFSVSPDGTQLVETKTQTEREVVSEAANQPGAVMKGVKSELVFDRHLSK